ncbi:MHS family alpha-ketoglutarate permease-like MFS transporter [Amycolatopsis bartoniae]|uniref:Putative proline/betaine transporter n=1 Tax=Amycolatopsis bartoniae TaxID=941986 RepID=A0A8H9IYM1_9PSEU|nr:MFS transporter [Amycolatopsis bartoniae]MBB2936274.1 MHS family alpha-ketoglutarate permease-like MFS transporter [Amycolatopsis bartoniae]TVT11567.1 MFS transporter [Amycolatopsis bartoniae]GHF79020.1 MFS transporter [Amycolatopsis bartoniae]
MPAEENIVAAVDTVGGVVRPTRITRKGRKAIFAGALGNAIEFLDWGVYSALAPVFAGQFFPSGNTVTAFLSTLAIFAVGFFVRPVGAVVLGAYADRYGRKRALALTVTLMSAGGFIIAVCPTYERIGVLAPVVLLVARLVQGFSAGGEWPSAVSYIVESAPPRRRAFAGSFQQVSTAAGVLLASLLGLVVTSALNEAQMHAFGWRIAFAVVAALGLIVLWLRSRTQETEHFGNAELSGKPHGPVKTLFAEHKLGLLRVVGITVPGTILYYLWITNMPGYASTTTGLSLDKALLANSLAVVVFMLLLPLGGLVSDRLGRRSTFMFFLVGFAVFAWPAYHLLDGGGFWTLLLVELVGVILLVGNSANVAAIYAELFPTPVRTSGTGIPYAAAVAVFGGTAPYFTTWLASIGQQDKIWIYVVASVAVGVVTIMTMPDGAKKRALD